MMQTMNVPGCWPGGYLDPKGGYSCYSSRQIGAPDGMSISVVGSPGMGTLAASTAPGRRVHVGDVLLPSASVDDELLNPFKLGYVSRACACSLRRLVRSFHFVSRVRHCCVVPCPMCASSV